MKQTYLFFFALFLFSTVGFTQNLYTHPNAANITNEEDSEAGWSGPAEIESKDNDPKDGEYSLRIKSEDEGRYAEYAFTANPGTTYTITIWARRGNNSNPEFDDWQGFVDFQKKNITGQGWKEYVFIVTAITNNPKVRVYASKNDSDDKTVFIDAVSIFVYNESDNEPPTAPSNLTASNTTSSGVTLNWSPSSDNIGVSGYRVFANNNNIGQIAGTSYSVGGLTASTQYSLYVKAYDQEGNTSEASNTITITTLESGNGGGGGSGSGTAYTNENANLPSIDWQARNMYAAGFMGIGTQPNDDFRLSVNGRIRAKEVIVESGWSDFVFESDYKLPTLKEVSKHIKEHGHLIGVPSEKEVHENGIGLAEINTILLQKIEEMTLYMLEADRRIEALEKEKLERDRME